MSKQIQRFDVKGKQTIIETFRAMRAYFERVAEAKGKKLDPAWYDDGPETLPHLWKDQPEILASVGKRQ